MFIYILVAKQVLFFVLPIIPQMSAGSKDSKSYNFVVIFQCRVLGNKDSTRQTGICQSCLSRCRQHLLSLTWKKLMRFFSRHLERGIFEKTLILDIFN